MYSNGRDVNNCIWLETNLMQFIVSL